MSTTTTPGTTKDRVADYMRVKVPPPEDKFGEEYLEDKSSVRRWI